MCQAGEMSLNKTFSYLWLKCAMLVHIGLLFAFFVKDHQTIIPAEFHQNLPTTEEEMFKI
jgi:hypothetical protein